MGTKMSFVISRSADFWGEIDSNLDLIPEYKNGLIRLPTERRGPLLEGTGLHYQPQSVDRFQVLLLRRLVSFVSQVLQVMGFSDP